MTLFSWVTFQLYTVCEQTKQILEHGIAANVAKKLKQPNSEQNKSEFVSDVERPSSSSYVASTSAVVQLPEEYMPPTKRKRSRVLSFDRIWWTTRWYVGESNVLSSAATPTIKTVVPAAAAAAAQSSDTGLQIFSAESADARFIEISGSG
ncbi:uncharacterized protein LOC117104466 isoform X2 [Anneissia japonica]|uniref:uncharacterized protein LOC117104466 isoform X2 n=1 Tax=Anneissia japonica TaxID=1529436 RepID=UPI00142587CA|nr:uncharacterized protein LOC117104466 isoform X2 [Anneissia japonica]